MLFFSQMISTRKQKQYLGNYGIDAFQALPFASYTNLGRFRLNYSKHYFCVHFWLYWIHSAIWFYILKITFRLNVDINLDICNYETQSYIYIQMWERRGNWVSRLMAIEAESLYEWSDYPNEGNHRLSKCAALSGCTFLHSSFVYTRLSTSFV